MCPREISHHSTDAFVLGESFFVAALASVAESDNNPAVDNEPDSSGSETKEPAETAVEAAEPAEAA